MSEDELDLRNTPPDLVVEAIVAAVRAEALAYVGRCDAILDLARTTPASTDRISGERGAVTELAFALHLTEHTAQAWWDEAHELTRRPLIRAALLTGRTDVTRARLLLSELATLNDTLADTLQAELLGDDRTVTHRPGDLRRWLHRQSVRHDPAGAATRRREADRHQTGLRYRPLPDGLAQAILTGPADRVLGLIRTLDQLTPPADPAHEPDPADRRTHGQLIFATAIGAVHQAAGHAGLAPAPVELHLQLPAQPDSYRTHPRHAQPEPRTLHLTPEGLRAVHDARALLSGHAPSGYISSTQDRRHTSRRQSTPSLPLPADAIPTLLGYGPIDPAYAAALLFDTDQPLQVRRLLTEPRTGICAIDPTPLAPDQLARTPIPQPPGETSSYRPTTAQRRVANTRDRTCTAPGCARPAHQCELDHLTRHPHGATTLGNLAPKCKHHHTLKHQDWTVTRAPEGTETWTSPRGNHYPTQRPDP